MRKLVVLCLAAGMLGCGSLPKLHVGVGASAVIPDESTLENTYMVDLFTRVDVASFQAELAVGWKTYDYSYDSDGNGSLDESGELEQIPVAATLRWVTGPGMARLIVGGGLVWSVNDINEIADIQGTEDAVGYRAVLGVDIKVIQDLRISIEGIYDFNEADIDSTLGGESVDTSGATGRLAIAYNF
ncbi:MAG: hypothetical protein ACYTKD_09195 [Planctomycetota bacterium]